MKLPKICIIVPCFNEEEILPFTIETLSKILINLKKSDVIDKESYIEFIDDGSQDLTWDIIMDASKIDRSIKGIRFSKNNGHQTALWAGLEKAYLDTDATISIDADLQQDPDKIPEFIQKFIQGADMVLGIRNDRSTDTFFKKITALSFYKLMHVFGVNIIQNHADYRLLSRKATQAMLSYKEYFLFLRALVNEVGFRKDYVYFDVGERIAGESKYPFKKMMSFAITGITSFSIITLRMIATLGFLILITTIIMSLYILVSYFFGNVVPGWASTVLPIYFLGGVQIFSIGLVGEYVGKSFIETKRRPKYFIEKETTSEKS